MHLTDRELPGVRPPELNIPPGPMPILGNRQSAMQIVMPALLLCLLNLVKPLEIDDPAYYAFSRQAARHPTDPYGFRLLWFQQAQPAHEILAPPAFNYWLALGLRLFGESPWVAKAWLFPICLLLSASLSALLRRFAPSIRKPLLWMTMLSPAVLPLLSLMIDVPSLALTLTSVELLLRSCDRNSWRTAAFAGVVAGLAMQTKYTAVTAPLVFMAAAATGNRRRSAIALGAVAVACAVAVFASWELFVAWKYGQSQFVVQIAQHRATWLNRAELATSIISLLGGVGAPLGLLAMLACGVRHRWIVLSALAIVAGLILVGYPPRWLDERITRLIAFGVPGLITAAMLVGTSLTAFGRSEPGRQQFFLALWWLVELGVALVISPWSASRRVIGLVVVGTLLAGHRIGVVDAIRRRSVRFVAAFGIGLGLFYHSIDTLDAWAEYQIVAETRDWISGVDPYGDPIYFVGHWGMQFYAGQAGWHDVELDKTHLPTWTWLVISPRDYGARPVRPPVDAVYVYSVAIRSHRPVATIPWLHGTNSPLRRHRGPITQLDIYRTRSECIVKLR